MSTLTIDEMALIEGGVWWKCILGTAGMAGLGALTGGGAGSVIPALGTTAGAVYGGIAGALVGAATFC